MDFDALSDLLATHEAAIQDTLLYGSFWALLYGSLCFVARGLPAPTGKATRAEWCNQVQSMFHCFAAVVRPASVHVHKCVLSFLS